MRNTRKGMLMNVRSLVRADLFRVLLAAVGLTYLKICFMRHVIYKEWQFSLAALSELPVIALIFGAVCLLLRRFPRACRWVVLSVYALMSFMFLAMVLYYQYFGTLVTYTSLFELRQAKEVTDSIVSLVRKPFLLLVADVPVWMLATAVFHRRRQGRGETEGRKEPAWIYVALLLATAVIALGNTYRTASAGIINELKIAEAMGVLSYQAYVAFTDWKRQPAWTEGDISPENIRALKRIDTPKQPVYWSKAQGKDLYIIQLEAFQNFVIGRTVDGQEITPNLNALAAESLYFDRFFQQIGKGNTSDAEFAVNTSLYPTNTLPMSKLTAGREVPSLPRLLRPLGYESVTLHTNEVEFWSRDAMYPALGFDRYYDKAYFGEEDVIMFGASDEVLYRKAMPVFEEIKSRGFSVYAHLIAMSSHNPFDLPPDKPTLRLPREWENTLFGKYIQACHYADYALGTFIEELKARGWWDDAMIVVYGDHFGFPANAPEEERRLAAEWLGIPAYTRVQMFNVPLIIRVPGIEEGEVIRRTGGQVDLLPTVANLMGVDISGMIAFGQDLLNHGDNVLGQRFYLPTGSFINEEVMFIPGKTFDDGYVLPLEPGRRLPDKEKYREDFRRVMKLLEWSDAYVEQLPYLDDAVPVHAEYGESDEG